MDHSGSLMLVEASELTLAKSTVLKSASRYLRSIRSLLSESGQLCRDTSTKVCPIPAGVTPQIINGIKKLFYGIGRLDTRDMKVVCTLPTSTDHQQNSFITCSP